MELMHNEVVHITSGDLEGVYRIVLDEPQMGVVAVVRLDPDKDATPSKGGRKRLLSTKRPRKKAPPALVGNLVWLDRQQVERMDAAGQVVKAHIDLPGDFYKPLKNARSNELFEKHKTIMAKFFDFDLLRDSLLVHQGLGGIVAATVKDMGASRSTVYKLWSAMAQAGITRMSLRPRWSNCGAPGVLRPCDPGGRKKAGRKTKKQRVNAVFGLVLPDEQPGMSTAWRDLILAADLAIPTPKPAWHSRCNRILSSHFMCRFHYVDGKLVQIELGKAESGKGGRKRKSAEDGEVIEEEPKFGEYPNRAQIRRVLEVDQPKLVRLAQSTTAGHFLRSKRGLVARNWKGVSGPGHTWAIDSTIGDIYLRSSLNPAWIIGRPVVYIIVDVWSTAIVGFHVCLRGPSWDVAKLSLFSAGAPPELLGELWGYEPITSLSPSPTLPAVLMCDRGEYLSRGASETAMRLIPNMSYAAPYRPDLKGIVEVLHRILKDTQRCDFIPGAIDARRAEMELRRFNPNDGIFTIRQFVHYLQTIFTNYNLTADRSARLDAHMIAAGVFPSPAGLWRFGHQMKIGFRRDFPLSELVTSLLFNDTAKVTRTGVMYAGRQYENTVLNELQWTAHARNFGGWEIPCSHFPGSVSRIWTPGVEGNNLLDLKISEETTASAELTFDEVADAFAYSQLGRAQREHVKAMEALRSLRAVEALVANARAETAAAIARASGVMPTISEARKLEDAAHLGNQQPSSDASSSPSPYDDAEDAHQQMMKSMFAAATEMAAPDGK